MIRVSDTVHSKSLTETGLRLLQIRDIRLSVHEDILHIGRIKAVMNFLEKRIAADRNFLMPTRAGQRGRQI